MALTGDTFAFYLSVAAAYQDPQPDPDQSLGGYQSLTRVEEVESSVTTGVSTYKFQDNTQTGADHTGKWMVFVTGNNAIDARRIMAHDNTTGDMDFYPAWGTAPAIGEIYRISRPGHLFNDVTFAQCAVGHTDHRCLYVYNLTGVPLPDIRIYAKRLDQANTVMEVVAGNKQIGSNVVPSIADEEDTPDTDATGAGGFTVATPQRFRLVEDYAAARDVPNTSGGFTLNTGWQSPLWVRRTIPALHKRVDASAWLLVAEETGGVATAVVLVSDLLGFTPDFTVLVDRTPRTFGGARVTAAVLDEELGLAIEEESVAIALTAGPGVLNSDAQPLDTDVNGQAEAVYIAPEDDAQAGVSVTITATLGGDS